MAKHLHNVGTLSIPSGQTASQTYAVSSALGPLESLVFFTPATLPETVTVQASPIANPAASDWKTLQLTGTGAATDVTLAAGKAVSVALVAGFRAIRVVAGVGVAAQRDFPVVAQLDGDYQG
jgi:hypothetical protein